MEAVLSAPVGPGQPNRTNDVLLVQRLLNRHMVTTGMRVQMNGKFDLWLEGAIVRFQREHLRQTYANGIVRPNDNMYWQLVEMMPVRLLAGALGGILFVPADGPLRLEEEDFERVGHALSCEPRTVKAVNSVESSYGPYDEQGRPAILFERHVFSGLTFHRYDIRYPSISSMFPGGYFFPQADQYLRLQLAFALDRDAALQSASWGGFQILGKNYASAGYGTVLAFVQAMCRSKDEQCDAFVQFVKSDRALWTALQQKDWVTVARHYNGEVYWKAKPAYNKRLETAYAEASQ